jgi:hypothetical protein
LSEPFSQFTSHLAPRLLTQSTNTVRCLGDVIERCLVKDGGKRQPKLSGIREHCFADLTDDAEG